jgi:Ca2+/H+ antiporter, TMEM165/GDT1 family
MIDWKLFFSTFGLIFVAELPDKTALATLLMATQSSPWPLFIGVALAFLVQNIVAISLGSLFGKLPSEWVHLASGALFLIFAFMALRRPTEAEEKELESEVKSSSRTFLLTVWKAFVVIFIAEWGDLTQLATASLTARYNAPVTLFLSSTLSLWSVTALVIVVGNKLGKAVHPKYLNWAAAVAFSAVGIYLIYSR